MNNTLVQYRSTEGKQNNQSSDQDYTHETTRKKINIIRSEICISLYWHGVQVVNCNPLGSNSPPQMQIVLKERVKKKMFCVN